jgi:L-ribulose-5-phosphate 3-epimerase
MNTSRRDFLKSIPIAAAAAAVFSKSYASGITEGAPAISIFSKCLQWLEYEQMAVFAKEVGFNGVDLTVRPNGHVLPENVKSDLPKAVSIIKKAGLEVTSITTTIADASDAHAEKILSTASELGIRYYRLNWIDYDAAISVDQNLEQIKSKFSALVQLNQKYQIHGAYQNHAGVSFGASLWDLYLVLKDFDPRYIGCQYDVRHAVVEGANSWVNDLKRIAPYIKTTNIKDFQWVKRDKGWKAESVPLGEGMVDFKKYFDLIKQNDITGPMCMHFEYPLGGADQGARSITIPKEQIANAMRRDLQKLREMMIA